MRDGLCEGRQDREWRCKMGYVRVDRTESGDAGKEMSAKKCARVTKSSIYFYEKYNRREKG